MAQRKPAASADTTLAVDQFMAKLDHACKAEVQALREVILAADPSIGEGIKWNSPSYRTGEYFATTNLRAKKGIGVILHLGAKVCALPAGGVAIDDPGKLLRWLGKDRAMVEFDDLADVRKKKAAFTAVVRRWIEFV